MRTPLYDLHIRLGGKMGDFQGWSLPVQFAGVMAEHSATRRAASLFDVSHMGQLRIEAPAAALEAYMPADLVGLAPGRQRLTVLTNAEGGILDDLMVANRGDHWALVVNAANAAADLSHLAALAPERLDRALLALQGPEAAPVLAGLADIGAMRFMDVRDVEVGGVPATVTRGGYTGEDGFEISVRPEDAIPLAEALLALGVVPAGLGARDSLRLEAGLCLHGQDIDAATSPIEGDIAFTVNKARRAAGARPGGFPGSARILADLAEGPSRRRQGILPDGRAPWRRGTPLYLREDDADAAGQVTSGGFGPTLNRPIAMGYLPPLTPGTEIWAELRGKRVPGHTAPLPFYKRSL